VSQAASERTLEVCESWEEIRTLLTGWEVRAEIGAGCPSSWNSPIEDGSVRSVAGKGVRNERVSPSLDEFSEVGLCDSPTGLLSTRAKASDAALPQPDPEGVLGDPKPLGDFLDSEESGRI